MSTETDHDAKLAEVAEGIRLLATDPPTSDEADALASQLGLLSQHARSLREQGDHVGFATTVEQAHQDWRDKGKPLVEGMTPPTS